MCQFTMHTCFWQGGILEEAILNIESILTIPNRARALWLHDIIA